LKEARGSLIHREIRSLPAAKPTSHGFHAGIPHPLERIRREYRSVAAPAVQHDVGPGVRDQRFDVALENTSANVGGAGDVAAVPFRVLAYIDQPVSVAALDTRMHGCHVGLGHARPRIVDQAQESGIVFHPVLI
jgi:hypothetical protein